MHLRIVDSGTGQLILQSNQFRLLNAAGSENLIDANENGAVTLYYDASTKFETKTDGINVTGELQCDSLDVDGAADITGNVTLHANLDLQDSDKILLGTGDDLQIYHDGSNSYISEGGTGVLKISSNRTEILSGSGEICAHFQGDGSVDLYYDNSRKLETKTDGVDITGELQCDSLDVDGAADITGSVTLHGNLDLQDSDRLRLGSSDDLQIYHDGTDSFIDNSAADLILRSTGDDVIIRAADDVIIQTASSENAIVCNDNGGVDIYHNAVKKFETSSGGAAVTGTLNASGIITAEAGAVAEIGALSDGATVTPDLATHCNFTITLGGNRTLANPSNVVAGQSGSIFVVQDGTGGRSFNSFGSYWDFIGGTVPTFTSTAGAVDRLDYIVRSSTKIHVVFTANYS